MDTNKISIKSLLLAIAAILVIESTVGAAISRLITRPIVGMGIARLLEAFVMLIIVYQVEKQLDAIGLSHDQIKTGIRKGLIWSAGFGVIAGLSYFILLFFGFNALKMMQVNLNGGTPAIILFFIVGAFIGPVTEEIFFRGILYGFFRRWGFPAALLITTVLFVLSHATRSGLPITQTVGGIIFALAYEIEGSLMVPLVIHCLGNLAIFSLGFLT